MKFDFYQFISNYFSEICSSVIYCETNPAIITNTDIKKVDSKIVKTSVKKEFQLNKYNCKIQDIETLLHQELINAIKSTQYVTPLDWKRKKFYFFNSFNLTGLLKNIENSQLILTSCKIKDRIYNKTKNKKIIIDNSIVNEVFCLNVDSIELIINKNFTTADNQIQFELLIYNKNTKKILLE